ncbi:hypothetical protein EGR_02867 [Echinococcus granulosus]|uniref:Uncharacterized protein n=1 Tax=Echinococcus granulosus TaxID=6210 RepID=W6V7H5_ECHGR|nr:hypothetical protein EGR_02867 [Echinococcus granulosus]EUB62414.1 hypothetical protein EGR_02867 [Echinococcus granulosus]
MSIYVEQMRSKYTYLRIRMQRSNSVCRSTTSKTKWYLSFCHWMAVVYGRVSRRDWLDSKHQINQELEDALASLAKPQSPSGQMRAISLKNLPSL